MKAQNFWKRYKQQTSGENGLPFTRTLSFGVCFCVHVFVLDEWYKHEFLPINNLCLIVTAN